MILYQKSWLDLFVYRKPTNVRDEYGRTSLWWAAWRGHEKVVRMLISIRDVDRNCKDTVFEQTPLLRAAKGGRLGAMRLLLENNRVNVNIKDKFGMSPISWVALRGHAGAIKALIEATATVDARDKQNRTPLHVAALNGHVEAIRTLIEATATLDARENE